jgi:NAD(P)-dependent dehydrogenase (short-subunit alcohol dehydrogenase family)
MSQSGDRRTIFITGAGSGIGRATAQLFAERGWFVGLYDVNQVALAETQALIPRERQTSGLFDVRDKHGWASAVGQFGDVTGGKLHVLFNNAGIARHGRFEDINQDDADLVVDVNVKGVINGVYAALPLLRNTPQARIINTASAAGLYGSPRLAVYSATKFAVRGLTEALDIEFAPYGVRVVSLMPFFIDTPILDTPSSSSNAVDIRARAKTGALPVYPVREAAEGAWEAAHTKKLHIQVGKMAKQTAFAARFMPNTMAKRLKAQLTEQ